MSIACHQNKVVRVGVGDCIVVWVVIVWPVGL